MLQSDSDYKFSQTSTRRGPCFGFFYLGVRYGDLKWLIYKIHLIKTSEHSRNVLFVTLQCLKINKSHSFECCNAKHYVPDGGQCALDALNSKFDTCNIA